MAQFSFLILEFCSKYSKLKNSSRMAHTKDLILGNLITCNPTLLFDGLASSLHHKFHCNWGADPNIDVTKSFQSFGIILLWMAHEFNIFLTKGECKTYETIGSLNVFKSNISVGSLHSLVDIYHLLMVLEW